MNRHNDKNLPRTSNINITLRGKNESNDPTKTESKITWIAKQSIDTIKRDLSYITQPQVFYSRSSTRNDSFNIYTRKYFTYRG